MMTHLFKVTLLLIARHPDRFVCFDSLVFHPQKSALFKAACDIYRSKPGHVLLFKTKALFS